MKRIATSIFFACAACASASALAVMVSSAPPAGTRVVPPTVSKSAAAAHADDSSGLRAGTVQGLDVGKGTFRVYGQPVAFDPKKVQVIGKDGKPASIYNLKNGAHVRFTVDPKDATRKRVGTLFLD